jgi:hypothetical protein
MRQDAIARRKQERVMEMIRQSVANHKSETETEVEPETETEKSE